NDVGCRRSVGLKRQHQPSDLEKDLLDLPARPERLTVFQSLCSTKQLNREYLFYVLHDLPQFESRRHTHRNMILFAARGQYAIHTSPMREYLTFIEESRSSNVSYHVTR